MRLSGPKRFLRALALPFALLAGGCSAQVPAPQAQLAAGVEAGGPALWLLEDDDTTIYLFGTFHALPGGEDWLKGPLADALAASDALVTEYDMDLQAEVAGIMAQSAPLPEGQNLRELMPPEDRKAYEAAMVGYGLPITAYDAYRPWFAALLLVQRGLQQDKIVASDGAEAVLLANRRPGVELEGLETIESQRDLFATMPDEQQLAYLRETVAALPQLSEQVRLMAAAWLAGDTDKLDILEEVEKSDPQLKERMMLARNRAWARWIDQRMEQPGTVFVAVGTGHLVGKGSVQRELRKYRIRAKRLQ